MGALVPVDPTKVPRQRGADRLCIVAVLLALAGIAPHGVDALTRFVNAVRGVSSVAVGTANASSEVSK